MISSFAKRGWLSRLSPDLNVLDYFNWGYAQEKVFEAQLETISELKTVIENVQNDLNKSEMIFDAVSNILKQVQLHIGNYGSHFLNKNEIYSCQVWLFHFTEK